MHLKLRSPDAAAALAHAALLDLAAAESCESLGADPVPAGTARRWLERHGAAPECVLVVAEREGDPEPAGLCATLPFEDPLTGTTEPLVVALWVAPTLRHRGVARALVAEVTRLCAARGLPAPAVRAAHNDDAVISMGERWGYVRTWELMRKE